MGIIAVAGGTGSVGRTIVEALTTRAKDKIIVLSRTARNPVQNFSYLQVDYDNVASTGASLESASIDTVICALSMLSEESNQAQLNLIKAAAASKSTKRFIISVFDMYAPKKYINELPTAKWQYEAIDALERTNLQYTRVVNGFFLDYYGMPHWPSHLKPWINSVCVEGKWAVIPGDGSARMNFITSRDMAKFVARMMDLETWPKVSSIVGHTLTFPQILEIAERVRGEKFRVIYDSVERLASGRISFPEFPEVDYGLSPVEWERILAGIHRLAALKAFLVPSDDPLDNYFPDIKLTTVAEVIESSWEGR